MTAIFARHARIVLAFSHCHGHPAGVSHLDVSNGVNLEMRSRCRFHISLLARRVTR
jgi:hypothetical protein